MLAAPVPVAAPRLVAGVGVGAPYYYAPPVWFGAGYFGPHWSYGHVYGHGYGYGYGYAYRGLRRGYGVGYRHR